MIIKGEKVILRPIKMSDAPRFVKWLGDSSVNKFTTRRNVSLAEEKKWIRELPKKKNQCHFAINVADGTHIGSIGLSINRQDHNGRLGILIGDKRYWSKGYGTEAMKIIINHGFGKLKLHRLELNVYEYNPRAIKVYKRLGFKLEGREREYVLYKGKYHDSLYMGILDREWLQKRKLW